MKKMKEKTLLMALVVGLMANFGCQDGKEGSGKQLEEIKTEDKINAIIRNPISADGSIDTVNVAKMVFEETVFDFGEIDEGGIIKHEFKFTNTGKVPLLIQNANSTCGCTIAEWPKELIEPGKTGVIKAEFNTQGKADFQEKPVTITANTFPSVTKVFIKGIVHKKG